MDSSRPPAVSLHGVTVRFGGVEIISNITANVERASVTAIIGPNGAGKTTLLRAILGLTAFSGRVQFPDETGSPAREPPRIGYVPQRLDFDRGMPMTVLDLLAMSHQRRPVWLGVSRHARSSAEELLHRVEAGHLIERQIGKLSGGELQRVQLALALQLDPEIVLLDEPVSGVDVAGEQLFCDLLASVQAQSRLTLVMVSHDLSVVSNHATHVICLDRKLLASGRVEAVLTTDVLAQAFGPHTAVGDLKGLSAHSHGPGCKH